MRSRGELVKGIESFLRKTRIGEVTVERSLGVSLEKLSPKGETMVAWHVSARIEVVNFI